jgi:hypothetical protein
MSVSDVKSARIGNWVTRGLATACAVLTVRSVRTAATAVFRVVSCIHSR